MPIFQNDTVQPVITATTNAVPYNIFVRLVHWNAIANKGAGAYKNTTGTVPPAGTYTVKVDFLEETSRICVDYWAQNVTLTYNSTTGPILPVKYWTFRQKSTDPTKTLRIRISDPRYNGGWPHIAAMPYNNSNFQRIITHQNQQTNKKTLASATVSYNIPERDSLCLGAATVSSSVTKTTSSTSTGSYVSI
jgi:hypothetical protein